ncbi:MAG: glycosyltransferase family 39 protein [candidate division NC10 bacterium]|nr:glycosyltransferase family 39 protein [candidate division NC10 bacterium]
MKRGVLEKEWLVLTFLFIWGLFVYYSHLGIPLRGDEGMYAAIARRMVRTGDWLQLVYEGRPYVNKPPLHFWLMALSLVLWGPTEFAIRFSSATFGIGMVFLVYFSGKLLFDRRLGMIAAFITTTTLSAAWHAHQARFDVELAFWVNLAFVTFYLAYRGGERRLGYLCFAFLSMAVATMLKGPVGLLLPTVAAFAFLVLTRRSKVVAEVPFLLAGMTIFLLVTVPYYLGLSDEFNRHFFVGENLTRVVHAPDSPFFYLLMIFADFFPWSLFLPCAGLYLLRSGSRHRDEADLLLRVWSIGFFVLLSLPARKAERFLVYLIPPFALLIARYWDHLLQDADTLQLVEARLLRVAAFLLGLVSVLGLFVGPRLIQLRFLMPHDAWPIPLALLLGFGCIGVLYTACRCQPQAIFSSVVAVAIVMTISLVQYFYPALARYESAKVIAQQVRAVVGDSPLVIFHPGQSLGEDILYYLDRPSPVPELQTPDEVYVAFEAKRRVFGLLSKSSFEELERRGNPPLTRLADHSYRQRDFVLVTNRYLAGGT